MGRNPGKRREEKGIKKIREERERERDSKEKGGEGEKARKREMRGLEGNGGKREGEGKERMDERGGEERVWEVDGGMRLEKARMQ